MSDNVDDLRFHNVFGAVKFTLKGDAAIKMINLYTRGNELLNGTLRIAGLDGTPTVSLTGEVNEESQFVQIAMPQAVQLNSDEGVAFYLSVPAGTLADGFFVEFIDKIYQWVAIIIFNCRIFLASCQKALQEQISGGYA